MASNPHVAVRPTFPMADHPNGMRMRAGRPTAGFPNPTVAPFPAAPDPDVSRAGRHRRHDFDLRRRRSLCLIHDDFTGGCGLFYDDGAAGMAFNDATCQQRQAGSD